MGYKKIAKILGIYPNTVRYHIQPSGRAKTLSRSARNMKINREAIRSLFGGACRKCGYKACLAALDFHHLDPKTKTGNVLKIIKSRGKHAAIEEAKKCILLCSNCHDELHDGMWCISELNLPEKIGAPARLRSENSPLATGRVTTTPQEQNGSPTG